MPAFLLIGQAEKFGQVEKINFRQEFKNILIQEGLWQTKYMML